MRRIACFLGLLVALTATDAFARQGVPLVPVEPQTTTPAGSRPQTTPPVMPAGTPVMPIAPSQTAPPPTRPPQVWPPSNRDASSSWQNVRIDVFITDTLTVDKPTNKVVSMLVLDGRSGQVRSNSQNGTINVDAAPAIRPDGRIYLQLTLEYLPEIVPLQPQLQQQGVNTIRSVAAFNESLMLVVGDGRRTVVSESSDPKSERKVTLEITATVVK